MPIGLWRVANVLDNAVFYREVAFPVLRGAATYILSRGTCESRDHCSPKCPGKRGVYVERPNRLSAVVLPGTRRGGAKTFELLDWSTDQAAYQTIDNPQVQSVSGSNGPDGPGHLATRSA